MIFLLPSLSEITLVPGPLEAVPPSRPQASKVFPLEIGGSLESLGLIQASLLPVVPC